MFSVGVTLESLLPNSLQLSMFGSYKIHLVVLYMGLKVLTSVALRYSPSMTNTVETED